MARTHGLQADLALLFIGVVGRNRCCARDGGAVLLRPSTRCTQLRTAALPPCLCIKVSTPLHLKKLCNAGNNTAQQADASRPLQEALCAAAARGRLPDVDRLVREGADIEWRDEVRTHS